MSNEDEKDTNEDIEETSDKANEDAKETEEMVKEGVKLGKNIATGNVVGTVKNAFNLLKNKKFRRRLIISILTPFLGIILAGALVLGIFETIVDTVGNAVGGFFQGIGQSFVNFFNPVGEELKIEIKDEMIDKIIEEIDKSGVSIDGLKLMGDVDYTKPDIQEENKKALRKYIKKFYEAQAITQTLNTEPDWQEKTTDDIYGNVYVLKADSESGDVIDGNNASYLKYTNIENMQNMKDKDSTDILNYFSIDEKGRLVYAGYKQVQNESQQVRNEVELYYEEYINLIEQYTTPASYYLDLAMVSQNPEFVLAMTDMARLSKIEITIIYETRTVKSTTTQIYDENTKKVVEKDNKYEKEVSKEYDKKEQTSKTVTTKIPKLVVNYVKSWYGEQRTTYNKVKHNSEPSINTNQWSEDEPQDLPLDEEYENESVTWKTDVEETIQITEEYTTYEEGVKGEVIDRIGTKQSQGLNDFNKVDDNTRFIGLLEQKFKIPNSTREDRAGDNIVSGAEMLFHLFQKDPMLQNAEHWMRYALNIYTDSDRYGDFEFTDLANEFTVGQTMSGSNFIVDTSKGDPSLCIKDAQVLKDAISKIYTGKIKENLTNEAQNFIDMQARYNVNAVFAMAVTIAESAGGTSWSAIDSSTYNWYSLSGSYNGNTYKNPQSSNDLSWRVYTSFKEATFDFGDWIANGPDYFKAERYTVEEIASTHCDETWGKAVILYMNEIYKAAGIEIYGEGFIEGGVTTYEEAKKLQQIIENELIHTKVHEKDYMYQNGPFAKWWNRGLPFQCDWWAKGRASMYLEQHGTKYKTGYPQTYGNGGDYYDINKNNGWFKYGNTPKPNSIISWRGGPTHIVNGVEIQYGHVAYVEGVCKDGIFISHAGNGYSWYGIEKIPLDGSLRWSGYTLNGYIYLDEPN